MNKKNIYFMLMLFLLIVSLNPVPSVFAGGNNVKVYSLSLKLYNQNTLKSLLPINTKHFQVDIVIRNLNNSKSVSLIFSPFNENNITFKIPAGKWKVVASILNISTGNNVYFGSTVISMNENKSVSLYLIPVGLIKGIVIDSQKVVIKNAKVKFDCGDNYKSLPIVNTDSFGTFISPLLPATTCYVYAVYKNFEWRNKINLTAGKIKRITIKLNTGFNIYDFFHNFFYLIVGIALILIIFFLVRILKLKNKSNHNTIISHLENLFNKKIKQNNSGDLDLQKNIDVVSEVKSVTPDETKININYNASNEMSQRLKIVYDTLKEKEKEVIDYLLKHENHAKASRIVIKLAIPKATLHRVLRSLEEKKIVILNRDRKSIEVTINKFYLN